LGSDADEAEDESDDEDLPSIKDASMANKVNKKTRKREKMLENIKKAHKKNKKKEKAPNFNFSALHLIHDPQGFAEKLFKKLETLTERFEVKLMMLELVSRLIGTHELQLLNFYPYIARFLTPHQREVVPMLQFSAQACHELVPPDVVEPVLKTIVNNFVTERNSAEVMAVGLNAIRELCARCPLCMTEELLQDLAEYKSYKNKAVMMASKSLIMLFRDLHPEMLMKKDRGKPTEAMANLARKGYGEAEVFDHVPGAEVLDVNQPAPVIEDKNSQQKKGKKRKLEDSEDEESDEDNWIELDQPEDPDAKLTIEEKAAKAAEVTSARILTDEDFKRIKDAQLRKQVSNAISKNKKQKTTKILEEEVNSTGGGRSELVNLEDIEMIHGKKKADKEARLAAVMKGREGRDKFGSGRQKLNEFASTTNKQKAKKKNFSMMKHKIKKKVKKSFREKQMDLQKSLIKRQKYGKK